VARLRDRVRVATGGADQPEAYVDLLARVVEVATELRVQVALRRRLRAPRAGLLDDHPSRGDNRRTSEWLAQVPAERRAQAGAAAGIETSGHSITVREMRRDPA
jgi:hypothetical protein